jgi:glycosyltransferase involved in cell wall biosynthesis
MMQSRISAVVPNFNHASLLPRSIGSLAGQSVLPLEVIVVDDASTDNSLQVLAELARKYPTVRVCPNEKNLGVNGSLNRGLQLARGDFVLFPAADDEVRPGLFEHAVRMFEQYPKAGLFSGLCEWRCTVSGMTWLQGAGMPARACYLSPEEMVGLARRGQLHIAGQHAIYRKEAIVAAGGWRPELQWFSDWMGGHTVSFRHGMTFVPEVLSNFYLFPTSYYNAKASVHAERRAVMLRLLGVLGDAAHADVYPRIKASGILGDFGPSMVRVVLGHRQHWSALTPAFIRHAARRSAEIAGRRYFPDWLARFCLRVFYGRR